MDERFLKEGWYVSASDADSEAQEGKYFVFGFTEAKNALLKAGFGEAETKEVMDYFGITRFGNFEHQRTNPIITHDTKPKRIEAAIVLLKQERQKVAYPFIDSKILTAWNALMVSALYEAGHTNKATQLLATLLQSLHVNGVLYHQIVLGSTLKIEGLLEDYAFVIEALLKAYESTQEMQYRDVANDLSHQALEKFYINETWYLSDKAFRAKAVLEDNSYKSPLATMIKNLFELGDEEKARRMLESFGGSLNAYAHAYPEAVRCVGRYM